MKFLKEQGFTVVEMIVAVVLVVVVVSLISSFVKSDGANIKNINTESVYKDFDCVHGYKFYRNKNGLNQLFDQNGKGVVCN